MVLKLKSPLRVQLEITDRCNHKCVHCYKPDQGYEKTPELPARELVKKISDAEVFRLIITGGEPFASKERLYSILEAAKKYPTLETSINSNGTLITKEDSALLKSYGIKGVLISLPSSDPGTLMSITRKDSLRQICDSIDLLLEEEYLSLQIQL